MKEIFQHACVTPICISCLVFAFPAVIHLVQSAIGWQKEAVDQQGRHHRKNQLRNDDLPCVIKEIQPVPDQKTEHINIQVIDQLVDQAHDQRQVDIVLIVVLGADAVEIADVDKQQRIKAKRTAVEQIQ